MNSENNLKYEYKQIKSNMETGLEYNQTLTGCR